MKSRDTSLKALARSMVRRRDAGQDWRRVSIVKTVLSIPDGVIPAGGSQNVGESPHDA